MTDSESIVVQLAVIVQRLNSIDEKLQERPILKHVDKDGVCDAYKTVVAHDRTLNQWAPDVCKIDEHEAKINQWAGALTAVALISSFLGGLIGVLAAWFGFKR